jgi:hypothetical protein
MAVNSGQWRSMAVNEIDRSRRAGMTNLPHQWVIAELGFDWALRFVPLWLRFVKTRDSVNKR